MASLRPRERASYDMGEQRANNGNNNFMYSSTPTHSSHDGSQASIGTSNLGSIHVPQSHTEEEIESDGNNHEGHSFSLSDDGSGDDKEYCPLWIKNKEKIQRDFAILEFVEKVWKFRPGDIPVRSHDNALVLDRVLCNRYLSAYDSSGFDEDVHIVNRTNPDPCEAFSHIADDILQQLGFDTHFQVSAFSYFFGILKRTAGGDKMRHSREIDLKLLTQAYRSAPHPSHNKVISSSEQQQEILDGASTLSRSRQDGIASNRVCRMVDLDVLRTICIYISSSIRWFVSGIFIKDTRMFLWYSDRMGILQTVSFDFIEQPHLLALVLSALTVAGSQALGLCPYISFPRRLSQNFSFDELEKNERVILRLPEAFDVDNKRTGPLRFYIDIREDRKIFHSHEITGRGTTVFPVVPMPFCAWTLGVRYTQEKLVAKLAWPSVDHRREDELIRVVRTKLSSSRRGKEYLRNVTDLRCSFTHQRNGSLDTELPSFLIDGLGNFDDRVFRIFILKAYLPLQEVNSAHEFKDIYTQVIKAHYWVVETSGILHCDISDNNVMFYRAGRQVIGVLADWDLAEYIEKLSSERPKRTGTKTFMSTDLQREVAPPHRLYRHDLEAFFFLLVWFCASFIPEMHDYNNHLQDWHQLDMSAVANLKLDFVRKRTSYLPTFALTHRSYRPLIADGGWVDNLRDLFKTVVYKGDHEVMRRKILPEARWKDWPKCEAVTYEEFMGCLGERV